MRPSPPSFSIGHVKFEPLGRNEFVKDLDLIRQNLEPLLKQLPLRSDLSERAASDAATGLAGAIILATQVKLSYDAPPSKAKRDLEHLANALQRSANLVKHLPDTARGALAIATTAEIGDGADVPDWSSLERMSRLARNAGQFARKAEPLALAETVAEVYAALTGGPPRDSRSGPYYRVITRVFEMAGFRGASSVDFGRRAARRVRGKNCR